MHCKKHLFHTVEEGDSLYHLAGYYKTTINQLLLLNQDLNPLDLQVNSKISVCPGPGFVENAADSANSGSEAAQGLISEMRTLFEERLYWKRLMMIGLIQRKRNIDEMYEKLLENTWAFKNLFAQYYTQEAARDIALKIAESARLGSSYLYTRKYDRSMEAEILLAQWHATANEIAKAFSQVNPYYDIESLRILLHTYVELNVNEKEARLGGRYPYKMPNFDIVLQHTMIIADYLSKGIIEQFPQKFAL
jgi:hypothetical protein